VGCVRSPAIIFSGQEKEQVGGNTVANDVENNTETGYTV